MIRGMYVKRGRKVYVVDEVNDKYVAIRQVGRRNNHIDYGKREYIGVEVFDSRFTVI